MAVASATGGNFENLVVSGSAGAVTTGLVDNDISSLSLAATPSLTEAGGSIVYTATLTQAPVTDLDVTLSNGAHITIPAGALTGTVSVPVAPNEDVYVDPTSVSASIASVSGGGIALSVDNTPAVTTIADTVDTTTVSLAATPAVAEGGFIQYTATLTSAAQTAVTVDLSNGEHITIAAGDTTGSVSVAAPADNVYLSAGNVSATITAASGGNFEQLAIDPAPAVTAVSDTLDTTTIWLTGSPVAVEGGNILYIVLLAAPAQTPVDVTLSDGSTLTIAAGSPSASILVPAPANDVYANTPAVTTHIVSAVGGNFESLVVDPTSVTTTLIDTPDVTTLTLAATSAVAEGGSIVYTATLTHVAQTDVTVTLTTGDTFTIAAGSSSGSVTVAAPANDVYQGASTVSASIATATGGNFEMLVLNPAPATTAVSDTLDTTTVSLSGAASVPEGNSAGYTVSLTSPAHGDVTVTLSYSGTAADGSDFTGVATVTIPDGASSANFSIATIDDAIAEGAESFTVAVASATGGNFESLVVSSSAGAVTTGLVDNDVSSLSLAATPSLTEAGGSIVYTATLTQAPVTALDITLSNGAVIHVNAGDLTGTVSVPVAPNEDVYVDPTSVSASIASVSGGGIALSVDNTPAVTTLADTVDTTTVTLSASAATVTEGGSIVYTASVDHAVTGSPLVIALTNGQTITIPVGQSSGTSPVFAVRGDDVYAQGDQTLTVGINGTSGGNYEALATTSTASTVVHDDSDTSTVSLSATAAVAEGGSIVYTATLSSPAHSDVTVTLSNGAVFTIASGSSSGSVAVTAGNDVYLGAASVSATIATATGGGFEQLAVDPAAATTTVSDTLDTTTVSLTGAATVVEGAAASYTVSLTSPAQADVTVTLHYSGTAADGSDYTGVATVTIPSGASSASFSVATLADGLSEGNESLVVSLAGATGGNFEQLALDATAGTVSTTLIDVDAPPSIIIDNVVVNEATGQATFTVTLSAPSAQTVTVDYATANGTATAGSDYTAASGSIAFAPGQTTQTVTVSIHNDTDTEPSESFSVNLSNASNATIATPQGLGTIVDNDAPPAIDLDADNSSGATGANHAVTFTEGMAGVPIADSDIVITDADSSSLTGATITLTNRQPGDALDLGLDVPGITANVVSTAGTVTITLSGNASPADYAQRIGNISFTNTDQNPSATPRTVTVDVTDGTHSSNLATTTINVVGVNDAAVITPAVEGLTETDAVLSTGGTLAISDVDSPATFVAQTNVPGSNGYGHFTLASNGVWTYTTDTAHNEFSPGTTYTDTLTVTSADGTTSTITVNILGTNDAAVITPAVVNLTETNAVLTTGGTLAISDVDSPATFVAQTNVAGSNGYGHFTLASNGVWTYTTDTAHNEFAAGTTYTDTLTVTSADGTTSTITVNILGTNDAAVITPATVALTETNAVLTTGGTLAVSDVDSPATFVAQTNVAGSNGYGHFTLASNGVWTYTTDTAHNEFAAGTTYADTLTVTSADGTTSTITVNILGTNDAAVITPATVNLTETNAVLSTGGTLAISDVDSPATFVAQTNVAGSNGYGHFTLASNGAWTYTTDTAHNEFAAGTTYTDTLTVTSADGTTSTITVNILGTNDAAVITPAVANLTETNAVLTTGGTLAVSDVDSPALFAAQTNVAGSNGYGHFTLASNGAWTYTTDTAHNEFAAGTTYTDTLTVTSIDGSTSTITVNILGTNDAAVITPATVILTETNAVLTTGGTLAISDVDSPATFVAQANVAGSNGYGHFTVGANGAWTYTTDTSHNEFVAGTTYTDTLTVTAADGTTSTITVNILGTNDAAVITPAVVNLTETNAVLTTGGTLAISDVDSPATFLAQSNVAGSNGYGHFTVGTNGTWTYTTDTAHNEFVAGTTYTDTLTVTAADGTTSTITVNILGTNDAAVITPATVNLTETNAVLATGGTLAIADVDSAATFVAQTNVAGSSGYGHFTLASNGAWTYATDTAHNEFAAGTTYTDTLTVTSADGTTSTITVNILGTNDAAVITPATVNLTETNAVLTTGGTLAIADVDSPATFVAQTNVAGSNGYGHFTLASNGVWTYTTDTAHNEFATGTTYTDTLTVTSADGTTSTITVNILGTNDAAVITPAVANLTETNAVLSTGGTLAVSDVDSPATFVAQTHVAGSAGYGHFNLATDGTWTYTTDTAHNEFAAGTTYTDTLAVTSADGTATTITVHIVGTNDAAVITPAVANLTETNAVLSTGGTLALSDVDSPATFVSQTNVAGSNGYGHFTLGTNGVWTYTTDTAHNEFVAGTTYTDTLTVTAADGTTSTITVNILGTNDTAVIAGTAAGNVVEDGGVNNATTGTPSASGALSVSDADAGQSSFQAPANLNGTYGTFSFNASTGAWTYVLDNTRSSTQALVAGQTVHDTLTVTSSDGSASRIIDITVNGSNDNASIAGTSAGSVTEAGGINNAAAGTPTATGTLTVSDVDNGQAVFQAPTAGSLNGTYGTFTFNASTGAWTYTLDNTRSATQALNAGQAVHDTLTVTSADGTASRLIDVTVNGSNDSAAISGTTTGTVTEAGGAGNGTPGTPNASGTLTVADVDNTGFQTPPSLAGTYGTFTFNASTGAWTYTLDNTRSATQSLVAGQVVHDTLTVASTDGTASQVIDVTVNGSNDNAAITGTATATVTEAGGAGNTLAGTPTASGSLTVTDVDSGQAVFQTPASLAGTYGTFTFNATTGAWTYALDNTRSATQALTAGQVVHDTLTVTSADGTASRVIDVTVNGANDNATIGGTATGSVTEAGGINNGSTGAPTATGTLSVADVDAGQAAFQAPGNLAGTYGTFSFNAATGAWTYTLDNTRAATQGLTAGQVVHDTLTVTSSDGTASQIIDVTVNGANDNASIGGTATGSVTEAGGASNGTAGTPTAGGTLTVTDVDAGQAAFQAPASLTGTYGTFTFNAATGAWTYTLDNTRGATQALVAGQQVHDTLTVSSTDGTASQIIDVTVTGANDNASIAGTATGTVTEAGGINNATAGTPTATGTLTVTDVDAGQAAFQTPASLAGTYGTFAFNTSTGVWTYTLDNTRTATQSLTAGQTVHDTLTVTSSDGTATRVIDVTVNGANDTATITGTATGAVTEAGGINNATAGTPTANGTLAVSDVDAGQAGFQTPASLAGTYGTFTFNTATGAWTYTLDNTRTATQALTAGQQVHDTLTVTCSDGSASQVIDVTVTGANDSAVIGGTTTGAVTEDVAVNGSGNLATGGTLTVSDVDAGQASFQAGTTTGAYGSFVLAANGVWTYTAANANAAIQALGSGQSLVDTFTVRSADGTASSVSVTINGSNDAPVATGSAVTGTEDTALVFNWANFGVTDIDTASSSLGVRITSLPSDGTLQVFNGSSWVGISANTLVSKATIDAGSLRFVPDANESGSDAYGGSGVGNQQADYARFNFTPNDGSTNGASAMMRIDIAPVADSPSLAHNASAQVTGTLSTLTSVGLSRDYYQGIQTLASGNSSTNPDVGEAGIESAVPTSSALVTNVGAAGNLSNDTGVQVAADDAYRVQGLIYLEAGKSYTFSGYADDTVRLELGGTTLMSGAWGVVGQAQSGTFTSNTYAPTVTGYYSLEFMVYNTSGPGSYDLNVSVNGATAVDLSTSNFLLFQSINQVDAAGGQRSAFVPNTTTGEGGYYPVSYDTGVQSKVYLAPVLAGLADTDGSESLAVQMQAIPVGATLTDGVNTFTATAANTSVNVTTWDRAHLAITLPDGYAGSTTLTAVATATEAAGGGSAVTSTSFAVTVDALGTTTTLAEIATFNADAIIGLGGNDVFSVSQNNAGLDVTITQGATGSIVAQSGTDTTATIHQAFYTGGGNDLVQSGAGNDTIYLGDSGSATHPVSGTTATQANVLAAQMMNLADTTALTSSSTGLFTNEAMDSTSSNNSAGNTNINTWADVANGGSGDDVIYGQNGTDFLYGGTGNDYLNGGAGIDGLRGGAGNDTLVGGAGNDVLRGDAGADVFKWEFADRGTTGAPASDIIMDFNTATPGNGGDVLDLRDLLQGESTTGGAPGNLSNYLHFTVSGGNTTIQISSSGGFSGGYSAGAVDQSIVLQNVDLTSGGALGTDQQIIQDLLNKSKLIVDGS
ncbi:MAG: VCBS domain-containing protein [Rhizobacter sp.]|nr:VCBS domain-containing protein [Rhizobacter sp.]